MSTQPLSTLRPLATRIAPLLLTGLLVSGCGGETSPTTQDTGVDRIEITLQDGAYSPQGERVEIAVDEPVVLEITADAAGQLHVHSTPEQTVAFEAGTSEHEVSIGRPGVVEVEAHDPALVVLQLEAR